ncbi:pentapeptide repeat-containing protein [Campylobacter coli]
MEEFDKEKAIEDIANGLNIEKDKIIYTNCYNIFQIGDYYISHLFQINESCISIIDAKIFQKYNLYFFNCEIPYLRLDFFENFIKFQSCVFNSDVLIRRFSGSVLIENSTFKGHFNISRIEKEICKIHINGNTFEEVSIFYNKFFNFYFENNSIRNITINENSFKDAYFNYNIFEECVFYKNSFEKLSFYGSNFKKPLRFFQNTIRDSLNIVNVKINFTFDDLQETINANNHTNFLEQNANDFRDSFRNFKSALIKDNNLLEASNFHKCELYCKELELKNKKATTFKDIVDRYQLFFYHKLCDHHTDILQSLNSLILVIGIFGILSVVIVFGFNYSLGYKLILEHLYFSLDFYNHHINSIIQDNYLFMIAVNLIMLFAYLILVGFALCLKCIREFFIIISYGVTLLALAVSPKILIPAMGIFTDKRAMLDPLSTIGGIYTIVFGFVVFSFIKTIRKNSIVPS